MSQPFPVDKVIDAFVKTRDEIEAIEAEAKAKVAPLKERQKKQQAYIQRHMEEQGIKTIRTDSGTAYINVAESVRVGDWDALLEYIRTTEEYELLNKAVNKTAALEMMGEKRQNQPPPGVKYTAIREVRVRRS